MTADILNDWMPEAEFAEQLRRKGKYGSQDTLRRWRRQNCVPPALEWMRISRSVYWRVKPEVMGAAR
jgi:hypothetical protein